MNSISNRHVLIGLIYTIIGLALGIYMAATQNHGQNVTHAHILLLGMVMSTLYGVIFRLWLPGAASALAKAQFWAHHIGTLIIVIGLYILYGQILPEPTIGPILGIGSIIALIGALSMFVLFVKADKAG